jgi:hypothetical protein
MIESAVSMKIVSNGEKANSTAPSGKENGRIRLAESYRLLGPKVNLLRFFLPLQMVLVRSLQKAVHALREFFVGRRFVDLGIGKPNVLDFPIVRRRIMLEAFG